MLDFFLIHGWSTLKKLIWLKAAALSKGVLKTVTGNPIHILDALAKPAQALSVKLEPIQDLNGYDNPWPAGGGVNKIDVNQLVSYGTTYGLTISFDGDWIVLSGEYTPTNQAANFRIATLRDTSVFPVTKFKAFPDSNTSSHMTSAPFGLADGNKTLTIYISGMVQGETYNLRCKIVGYEGDTAPTEWTPYSNICPISGHTDADVTRTGVNVWDEEWELGGLQGGTGNPFNATDRIRSVNYCPCKPSTSYYGYFGATSSVLIVWWFDEEKHYIDAVDGSNKVITAPANAAFFKISTYSGNYTTYLNDISINYPSTDTTYHAYVGTTYPIPLGQTVYGGTLDVTSGKLTIKWKNIDMGTANWNLHSNTANRQAWSMANSGSLIQAAVSQNDKVHAISPAFKSGSYNDTWTPYMIAVPNNNGTGLVACFESNAYSTNTEVQQALNGVQLVYELAEPFEITLTPTQVELLQGENNLFSDGEMTLVYLADGNASDEEAMNILLGGRYVNNHGEDEPSDREALDILLGR